MWAIDYGPTAKVRYNHIGHRRFVQAHYLPEPIVPVRATEHPEGTHYGWIDTNDTRPHMIFGNELQFKMCFPYGIAIEVERGKGRVVRLNVEHCEHTEP